MRIAMVGFGARAEEHLDALKKSREPFEIRVVCDSDKAALERAEKRMGQVRVGADLGSLLEECPCDLVVICLPPAVDLRPTVKAVAAAAGVKAVLIEKPVANTTREATEVMSGLPVPAFLFHQMRYLPWAVNAREWYRQRKATGASLVSIEGYCYGKFLDQGLHLFDLACWITGSIPARIHKAVAEHDPARISARSPLPFEWRRDYSHAGPTVFEVESGWDDEAKFLLKTGPSAAEGWLGKGLRLSCGDDDWFELGTTGASAGSPDGQSSESGTIEDYKKATTSVYEAFSHWLTGEGPEPDLPDLEEHSEHLRWYEAVINCEGIERLPSPSWLKSERSRTPILVVIPLSDHRGVAEDCVRSWTQEQKGCEEEDYQLVVISNQETKGIGEKVRPLLRENDLLIETELPMAELGQGDMEEYVIGIGASDSEWIFLTEPHCEVPSDIVIELKRFFETSEAAGFCTGAEDVVDTSWGMMEALYSAEGVEEWKKEGNWGKMIMRGFGVRRTAYERVGGFRLEYGRFSEWLLGADLHREGYYLDYAPKVRVLHHYTLEKPYLDEAIEEFVIGQAKYASSAPEGERLPYFPDPLAEVPLPPMLNSLFDKAAQIAKKKNIKSIRRRFRWISPAKKKQLARDWNSLLVHLLVGGLPKKAFPHFKNYYQAQIEASLLKHLPKFSNRDAASLQPGQGWDAGSDEFKSLVKVHPCENWKETSFHWAEPVFAIPIDVTAVSGHSVIFELMLPEGLGSVDEKVIFLISSWEENEPVSPTLVRGDGTVMLRFEVLLPNREAMPTSSENGWLLVGSPALETGSEEKRQLGLPVAALSISRG